LSEDDRQTAALFQGIPRFYGRHKDNVEAELHNEAVDPGYQTVITYV
jgi:hypothetical protein